jgi:predicted metal-dependent peptidase
MEEMGITKTMNDLLSTCNFSQRIGGSLLRLRMRSPFFATLAMFARFICSETIPTAATDGRDIYINPDFFQSLPIAQQDGLILHEVLHAALLHPFRLGVRDLQLWNIAADIVVNGTIARVGGLELPPGSLREKELEDFSVEEVYELLQRRGTRTSQLAHPDLISDRGKSSGKQEIAPTPDRPIGENDDSLDSQRQREIEAHWRNALQQATTIARTTQDGNLPAEIARELGVVLDSQLDWRSYLWRYLTHTPNDFQGFDRRLIGGGLYLEGLQGESVQVYLAVDTSGSVQEKEFELFMAEVGGVISAYPHLECELYYVNTDAIGPYFLTKNCEFPPVVGGGGTSFIPFFDRVSDVWDGHRNALCIYLTDGYGKFPSSPPPLPTLWIVTPGGLDLAQFPFGEAVRLIEG